MKEYLDLNNFSFQKKVENNCIRLDVQHGKQKCFIKIYPTGTILLQGAESELKKTLLQVKNNIEKEENIHNILPFEIEEFPKLLKKNIRNIDPIIVKFIEEAITTIKAGSNLGCAFLLGGASEKAIYLLVDAYAQAIPDHKKRTKFSSKTSNKFISKIFNEFKNSWTTSTNKPDGFSGLKDIEVKIEHIFQFCRICRNEAGHPNLPPNIDRGALIANMGQFMKYIKDLYVMIEYYSSNDVKF